MCLHFSEFFVAFAGDTTTHDISRQHITASRHRSRHQRRQRKNIIGFSQSLVDTENTSGEDSELEEDDFGFGDATGPSYSVGPSASSTDFLDRIDKMISELDGLVRFVRRGTETLAGGTGDAAPAFGVLAFTLEDWDS
jgi:gamma-tubulin complex component 5